nr:MAG TPA: hypothetical protein [Caudoviricetes sp.]
MTFYLPPFAIELGDSSLLTLLMAGSINFCRSFSKMLFYEKSHHWSVSRCYPFLTPLMASYFIICRIESIF